jgi:hypothetical protein
VIDRAQNNYLVGWENLPGTSKRCLTGKITDFGLSVIISEELQDDDNDHLTTDAKLWSAPELSREDRVQFHMFDKADVWSFALTALEVRPFGPASFLVIQWQIVGRY